jgi:hypothetical protein
LLAYLNVRFVQAAEADGLLYANLVIVTQRALARALEGGTSTSAHRRPGVQCARSTLIDSGSNGSRLYGTDGTLQPPTVTQRVELRATIESFNS